MREKKRGSILNGPSRGGGHARRDLPELQKRDDAAIAAPWVPGPSLQPRGVAAVAMPDVRASLSGVDGGGGARLLCALCAVRQFEFGTRESRARGAGRAAGAGDAVPHSRVPLRPLPDALLFHTSKQADCANARRRCGNNGNSGERGHSERGGNGKALNEVSRQRPSAAFLTNCRDAGYK